MTSNELTKKLEWLFAGNEKQANDFGLSGYFIIAPATFIIKPSLSRGFGNRQRWNYAWLRGTITQGANGKMQVTVETKPIMVYPVIIVALVLLVAGYFIAYFTGNGKISFLFTGLAMGFVVLPVLVGVAKAMAIGIQKDVEAILQLSKI